MTNQLLTATQMRALVESLGGKNRQEQADRVGVSRAMLTLYLKDGVPVKASYAVKKHLTQLAKEQGVL